MEISQSVGAIAEIMCIERMSKYVFKADFFMLEVTDHILVFLLASAQHSQDFAFLALIYLIFAIEKKTMYLAL